jgi:hypothetical protein
VVGERALDLPPVGREAASAGEQDEALDQVRMVNGQALGDRAAGGHADDRDRPAEFLRDGPGVIVRDVVQARARSQPRLHVHDIHGEVPRQAAKHPEVHPASPPFGVRGVTADPR